MKRLALIAATIVFSVTGLWGAEYPVDRGSMTIGGSISFLGLGGDLYEINKTHNSSSFYVAPEFGIFPWKGILIGGIAEFADVSRVDADYTLFSIGPMVGLYWIRDTDKVKGAIYPYIKQGLLYRSVDWVGLSKYEILTYMGKCGVNYMIARTVAIDVAAALHIDTAEFGDGSSADGHVLTFSAGIQAFVF